MAPLFPMVSWTGNLDLNMHSGAMAPIVEFAHIKRENDIKAKRVDRNQPVIDSNCDITPQSDLTIAALNGTMSWFDLFAEVLWPFKERVRGRLTPIK